MRTRTLIALIVAVALGAVAAVATYDLTRNGHPTPVSNDEDPGLTP